MADAPKTPEYRKRIGYQAGLLGGFSTLAAALLVAGNISTHAAIEARHREDLLASLARVVPAEIHDNDLLQDRIEVGDPGQAPVEVYRALKGEAVSGVSYRWTGYGYSGAILVLMGIDRNGHLLGVRVLSHAETPGLGDKIEPEKGDWIDRFKGLFLGDPPEEKWGVKKDGGHFDQFSGATITPRAVVKAVKEGLQFFDRHRYELLSTAKTTG